MKTKETRRWGTGILYLGLFVVWTRLLQTVDVQRAGQTNTEIGFATINDWFHRFVGVHMELYSITDWLGLVPICVCMGFSAIGLVQMIKGRSLLKVDFDLLLLGGYYLLVMLGYVFFEMVPINYRPVLIEGRLEASYPSSTTLLVLSVMESLVFQIRRRMRNCRARKAIELCSMAFSVFMVIGRLISGVHWVTDIVGAILLSAGLFCVYRGFVV